MSKLDLIKYKAYDRAWSKRDIQRVYKTLKELVKCNTEAENDLWLHFNDAEELSMLLNEPLDARLEWSLIRLIQEDKIEIHRTKEGGYMIGVLNF